MSCAGLIPLGVFLVFVEMKPGLWFDFAGLLKEY